MLEVFGLDAAKDFFDKVQAGVRAADGVEIRVQNAVPYAYGIITGFRRDGRVARRAGGSFSLSRGLEAMQSQIAPTLAFALPFGHNAVLSAFTLLGRALQNSVQEREVVKSGNLRRGYTVVLRPGRG